jgi:type I restriction enzyme S subunit
MEQYELPDVPSNWAKVALSELITSNGIFSDGDWVESKDQNPNGEVRLVQLADVGELAFTDRSDRWLTKIKADNLRCLYLEKGDILISRLGDPLGKACIYPGSDCAAVTVVDVCVLRIGHDSVDSRLLAYFINSPYMRAQIETHAGGTTRKRITGAKLKKTNILLPPLAEQRRIVDKIERLFSYLDEGERLLEQVQKQLSTYRQAVLKAAVTGELTKEWRAENRDKVESGKELLQRVLEERRKSWQGRGKYNEPVAPDASSLPKLPEDWVWATLEQLAYVETGGTPKKCNAEYYGGTVPWITSTAVNQDFIHKPQAYITDAALAETNAKVFPIGTLILAMYGEGKTRGKVSELAIQAATNQACAGILCQFLSENTKTIIKIILENNYHLIRSNSAGGVQPNLNLGLVKGLLIPLPPICEQTEIIKWVEKAKVSQVYMVESIKNEFRLLSSLRSAILKAAFSGELVGQDPNDEPASELLARIQEKQKQVKASNPQSGRTSKRSASV